MTPEEVIRAIPGKIIIHRGSVLFNTHDFKEAVAWEAPGATVRPWYPESELALLKARGRPVRQGWEVMVLGACEKIELEDVDGDLVDVTRDLLRPDSSRRALWHVAPEIIAVVEAAETWNTEGTRLHEALAALEAKL